MKSPKMLSTTSLLRRSVKRQVYLVRDDSLFCTGKWRPVFVKEFCAILQHYTDAEVVSFDALSQILSVERYLHRRYKRRCSVLSLDKWFGGDFNYNLSRVFSKGKGQSSPQSFYSSNEIDFTNWLSDIAYRDVVIVDDDIASGHTMNHIKRMLTIQGATIKGCISMSDVHNKEHKNNVYDIVDIRDFIPESLHGGLLCSDESATMKRIPYLYPDVDLCARMKLTKDAAVMFTDDLKQLLNRNERLINEAKHWRLGEG